MGKIGIIISREYFQRLKNKWFWIMTILGPLMIAGMMVFVVYLAIKDKTEQKIIVVDEKKIFIDSLKSTKNIRFVTIASTQAQGEALLLTGDYTGMLFIPQNFGTASAGAAILKYKKQPSFTTIEYLTKILESSYFELTLQANQVPDSVIKLSKAPVKLITQKLTVDGKEIKENYEAKIFVGFALGFCIYFFIFLYGVQIMRGVMEEKTNRIVEVIISSVKPFQLMMGKIIGIAMVGFTQFVLWIILTFTLTGVMNATLFKSIIDDKEQAKENKEIVFKHGADMKIKELGTVNTPNELIGKAEGLEDVDFVAIIFYFGIYFLGGYLLYAALFAAVGSAVDSETDTQQFMLPVTLPIIFSLICAQFVAMNPDGPLAFWLSMIPFTSPVTMMVRLPFGVPGWQLGLSIFFLIAGFIFTTWIAGKIYKTGILMYGKKASWKEIGKWLFYKS
jgi:ABC-2 type transport system permease protein